MFRHFVACNNFDVRNRLNEIEVPTLIIVGENDELTPPAYANYLSEHIRNSQLVVLKNAGHMLMLENVEDFMNCLKENL